MIKKNIISIIILVGVIITPSFVLAQKDKYHSTPHNQKYFASLGYGQGRAHWNSEVSQTDLYDGKGTIVNKDDLKFKIRNVSQNLTLNGMAPYGDFRLGLDISFEYFYLDKLILNNPKSTTKYYVPFNENFRFDKVTFLVEYPFDFLTESPFSFNLQGRIGYYGFSKVKSINFFGGPYLGNTYLLNLGGVIDYEVFPHYFLFAQFTGEFKNFRNDSRELPTVIRHKIFSAYWTTGIRINMYDIKFLKDKK